MRIVVFCHSLLSDWNHGNAHFLRGVCSELIARGHQVDIYEPENAWSYDNLLTETRGQESLAQLRHYYPSLKSTPYRPSNLDLFRVLSDADLVLVHEWNEHDLVRRIGVHHAGHGGYTLLFHDTHHRSVTDEQSMRAYDLSNYDGVLAFGAVIRRLYLDRGWTQNAWTWHEAADIRLFHPMPGAACEGDLIWIGNWGDDERTAELREFLLEPVRALGLKAKIHGVRYPAEALAALAASGIDYAGWLPNFKVPETFAHYRVTVHVPRRPYAQALRGIPTIRPFEALACGIPLISAPWQDSEGLFTAGEDYLVARDGAEMREHLTRVLHDKEFAAALARHGRETILARHTCSHRADELLNIYAELKSRPTLELQHVQ